MCITGKNMTTTLATSQLQHQSQRCSRACANDKHADLVMCPAFTLLLVLLQSRAAEASSTAASGSGGVWRSNVKARLQRMSVANVVPEGVVLSRDVKASARHDKPF